VLLLITILNPLGTGLQWAGMGRIEDVRRLGRTRFFVSGLSVQSEGFKNFCPGAENETRVTEAEYCEMPALTCEGLYCFTFAKTGIQPYLLVSAISILCCFILCLSLCILYKKNKLSPSPRRCQSGPFLSFFHSSAIRDLGPIQTARWFVKITPLHMSQKAIRIIA
jgi:hypothetical protein